MQSRRLVSGLSLVAVICALSCSSNLTATQQPNAAGDEPRITSAPEQETEDVKALVDRAESLLKGGSANITTILTDPAYMRAHEYPRFRKLIRTYAFSNNATIVTPQESGEPLKVSGTIRNSRGEPIRRALIYVYHTSAKGWYSDKAPHISGNAGDEKHARLFGYLTTNQEGFYEFQTIRPVGYPNSTLPAHIHFEIETTGDQSRTFVSEILFDGDPRLTSETRERSLREGLVICPVTRGADGVQHVQADFKI